MARCVSVDTPDPYVVLSVPGTNGGSQRTSSVDNCTQPVWNHQFEFLYDAELNNILGKTYTVTHRVNAGLRAGPRTG